MTGFLGALSDAWAEIRVHKLRVLLSLIGITRLPGNGNAAAQLYD